MEEPKTFYSQRSIYIATYIGGPLAAGYLIKKNYQSLDQDNLGAKAMIVGIVSTLILLIVLLSIPEHIIDKIPNILIPAIYTLIVYFIVEKIHGKELKEHKASDGKFYSVWKAAGIGFISTIILIVVGFVLAFIAGDLCNTESNFDTESYDKEIANFVKNEEEAIKVFDVLATESSDYLIKELTKGLELWNENKEIILKLNSFESIPIELISQNELLLKYSDLRIQHNEMIIKAISEDTDQYDIKIDNTWKKIEQVLKELG